MPSVGSTAPDFDLFVDKGEKISLSSLRGNKVVLAFVPAAFTGICTKELCEFQDKSASLGDLNAKVVGVSVDGLFSILAWKKENGIDFPIASDYTRETVKAYGVALENFAGMPGYTASTRAVFVVDEAGKVAFEWVGSPGDYPPMDDIQAALS